MKTERTPIRPPQDSFKPLLERAGLPAIGFHDLQHTRATLLLTRG